MQNWSRSSYFEPIEHYALLRHVVELRPQGIALEFGVGSGQSTRIIAERMPVVGFDSGLGLPEGWRPEFPAGSFAFDIPDISNATIMTGWFADTVPTFDFGLVGPIGLVHLDADLYSSTAIALEHVGPHLHPGSILVFDEFYGYDGCEGHEQKAFQEFIDRTGWEYSFIGHSHEAVAVCLES